MQVILIDNIYLPAQLQLLHVMFVVLPELSHISPFSRSKYGTHQTVSVLSRLLSTLAV